MAKRKRANSNSIKNGGELRCSGRESSSSSTCGTCRVSLITNPLISHEWGKDQYVITTNVTYPWSFVYPMLPVSLDCPFLIAPSVFSNVYILCNGYYNLPFCLILHSSLHSFNVWKLLSFSWQPLYMNFWQEFLFLL
jgi:hypothetical protein